MSMNYLYLRTFLRNAESPTVSEELYNETNANVLKLEVQCDSTIQLSIQARIDEQSNWTNLNVQKVNATNFTQSITSSGIYSINIAGLPHVRVSLNTVADADKVTVVGSLA